MFGMENKKTKEKTQSVFQFDLEKELLEKTKQTEYVKRIEGRILKIKELLRHGSKKEEFNDLGVLLNGYHALAVVLGRAAK
jgi:hypothetical protein